MSNIWARRPVFSLGYSLTLCLVLAVAGCSDDDEAKDGAAPCAQGMEVNPLTGQCRYIGREGPGTSDAGPAPGAPDTRGQGDTTPSTDGGSTEPDTTPGGQCVAGQRRCNSGNAEICLAGQYELSETCGANSTCQNGSYVPDGAVCSPGVTRCVSVNQYETCSADGGGYEGRVQCGGDEVCENGQCVSGCNSVIGEKSNIGCQYVSMRLNQSNGIRAQGHSVVVSNPGNEVVTVNVTSPGVGNLNMPPQSINPQQSAILNFPSSPMISEAGVSDQIYVINTSKPVIATQFAPLNNPGVGSETSDAS